VINVLAGKRYESITNEVKKYLRGCCRLANGQSGTIS